MYTLLVIDMQDGFLDRFYDDDVRNEVINNCRRVVVQAIADGAEIIDVNYLGSYGPTIPEIRILWRKYKKLFKSNVKKVIKRYDGGADEVMANNPVGAQFKVCGINAGACVKETARGLVKDYGQAVYVIKEAIANSWGNCDDDIRYYAHNNMLTILE